MKVRSCILTGILIMLGLLLLAPGTGRAQDLVYHPTNPAFGGSPLNYQWLMSSASKQNPYQQSSSYGYNSDPMANFQQSLQRQILSELTRKIVTQKFGNIDLTQKSQFNFGEFSINVVPGSNGIDINIFNTLSGEQTSITIPNL